MSRSIIEVRTGSDPAIRLAPGVKPYGVSVLTRPSVPALEAELPPASTSARSTVSADGRTFRNRLASVATDA